MSNARSAELQREWEELHRAVEFRTGALAIWRARFGANNKIVKDAEQALRDAEAAMEAFWDRITPELGS